MTTCLRVATLALIAVFTIGCNAQPRTQSGAAQSGGSQTRTVQDTEWGMPATVVTMPTGWKFDGLVTHGESCVSQTPGLRWAAESPDNTVEVQHYPPIHYSFSNDQQANGQTAQAGCLVTQYFKPQDFLTHVVAPALHPGAQVDAHLLQGGPDHAQERAEAAQQDRQMGQQGYSQRTEINNYELVLTFMRGSVKTSQVLVAEFYCVYTANGIQAVACTVDDAFTIRVPQTQLQSFMSAPPIRAQGSAQWSARSIQYLQQRISNGLNQQAAKIANDRQNQIARNDALIARQQAQYENGMRRAQAASDMRHAGDVAVSNHNGDQNTYRDPNTGNTYKVSNQYSHTYLDSTGRTILQSNSAYAPGPDTIWQELQPHN